MTMSAEQTTREDIMVSRRDFGRLAGSAGALAAIGLPTFAIAQAKPKVVVIGGGAGGATAAHYLVKDSGGAVDVTLVEGNRSYSSSFFSNLYLGGFRPYASLNHGYGDLGKLGVKLAFSRAVSVDAAKKIVTLANGQTLPYDRLVLSPGIDVNYESVPGYDRVAANTVAPHAYETSGPGKRALSALLAGLPDGGTVAMVMPNNPYRCPPGPYERACMIAHYLKTRKPKSKLVILDPKKSFSKQPVFEEAFQRHYKDIIEMNLSNDIDDFGVSRFDLRAREIVTKSRKVVKFSIANVIPQQRAGEIAMKAGVTSGDWVPVDPATMQAKANAAIYVLGDATVAADMPKSAFSANSQAKVAVNQILAEVAGKPKFPARYRNTCWSLLAPDDCVKIGANYAAADGKFAASGAFVSQKGEDATLRKQNYAESIDWYDGIIADMFAKKVAAAPTAAATKKG
jgi:NADPH-dependent 2,4-dienoyl-CoA reductase/sulfur reductase-like enzyme